MKKLLSKLALLALLSVPSAGTAFAADIPDEPIITFKTNIYSQYGDENSFHIVLGSTEQDYFDIDYGFGAEEVVVTPAYFDQETSAIKGTVVQMRAKPDGIVKIYGDPLKLDYFDAEGCYIEWIDLSKCVNLDIIDLQHNELKALDLTPQTNLSALYLTDNPFTAETPLVVGAPKPYLQILEIDIIDYLSDSFNLSDYPALVTFDGYHNMGLKSIDPTGCPELQVLSVELTPVSSIDVTRNPKLTRLNVNDSRITELDVSQNTYLRYLLAQHASGTINTDVKIKNIDVTNNPNLLMLNIAGNGMDHVDLSGNPILQNLSIRYNNFRTIDLSANPNLYSVDIAYNDMDYTTLPLPLDTWGEYYYNQNPLACDRSYPTGQAIDFSSRVLREGTQTSVRVWRDPLESEAVLLDEVNYSYADGKITFNTAMTDSVYVEFINSAFTDYTLRSGSFLVKNPAEIGQPSEIISFTATSAMAGKEISFGLAIDGASGSAPHNVYVSVGGAEPQAYPVTASGTTAADLTSVTLTLPASGAASVSVRAAEGDVITSFSADGITMSALTLTAATELRWLSVTNCNLRSVNLANNRCLKSLDLSGNRLASLDLTGVYGDYEKHVLTDLKAADNQLSNVVVVSTRQLQSLDLSGNRLTTFDLKNYDSILRLDLSDNRMAGELNLAYLTAAERIDLSHNSLDSVTVDSMPQLASFDISNNNFTIKTLPLLPASQAGVYSYAPQNALELVKRAPGINISAQYRVIDGEGTRFNWLTVDGTPLVEGVDMTCNNGATRFLRDDIGEVVCHMTHPAFPALSGENVFSTTAVEVTGAPTNVVASFTTTESSDATEVIFTGYSTTALYIDWRGDGTEYLQYPMVSDTYTAYPNQQTYAGANVKVYTYDSADDVAVFSIYGAKMENLDASPLKKLKAFSIGGAGLDEETLVFPAKENISELNLEGNNFSSKDFSEFTQLRSLVLTGNAYESFNASLLPQLETLVLANNKLTSVKFGNNALWGLELSGNRLESFSAEGAPALAQVILSHNSLSEVDFEANRNSLIALDLSHNSFDFSTLPRQAEFPRLSVYYFASQATLEAAIANGKIDLASQARVGDTETVYRWFLGDVTFDADTASLVGEELAGNDDADPEYWVKDGVTAFRYTFTEPVTGVLYNAAYDGLYLFTTPVLVSADGIEGITADGSAISPDEKVTIYNLSGIAVRSNIRFAEAMNGLPAGLYIVNGRKYLHR